MSELPITRIAAWFEKRKTLCEWCRKEPRVDIAGDDRYCSDDCAMGAAWFQANG